MTILNATPHVLNIHKDDGSIVILHPNIPAPRVSSSRSHLYYANGIPIDEITFGEVQGLFQHGGGSFATEGFASGG